MFGRRRLSPTLGEFYAFYGTKEENGEPNGVGKGEQEEEDEQEQRKYILI